MRIRAIEIRNFRKFAPGVRVTGFGDGLNLLVAPNEFGKSTIAAAARGILFEKYRSRSEAVQRMKTAGSETSPRIALDFEVAGNSWHLEKQFLHRTPSASLTGPTGRQFDNDAAEEELQRLLGFDAPGKLGSTPESQGIWGLLWVEQGHAEHLVLPATGRGAIRSCLEAEVGTLTGGERGVRILEAVEGEVRSFVSGRGLPHGTWKELLGTIEARTQEIGDLRKTRDALLRDLDSLERMRDESDRVGADGEDQRIETDILAVAVEIGEAQQFDLEVSRTQERRSRIEGERNNGLNELSARKTLQGRVAEAEQAYIRTQPILEDARSQTTTLRQEKATERETELALDGRFTEVKREETRLGDARRLFEKRNVLQGLEEALEKARVSAERMRELKAASDSLAVTATDLDQLHLAEHAAVKARAERDALAVRISFSLDSDVAGRVRLDGRPIAGPEHEELLTSPGTIEVDGVGRIHVRPGATDFEQAERTLRSAENALNRLLEGLAVASVKEAEDRLRRKDELRVKAATAASDIATLTRARTLADGTRIAVGLEAMEQAVAGLRATVRDLESRDLPVVERQEDLEALILRIQSDVTTIESELKQIGARRPGLDLRLETAIKNESRLDSTSAEAMRQKDGLEADLRRHISLESDEALRARIGQLELDFGAADAAARTLADQATTRTSLKTLEARRERLSSALSGRRTKRQELKVAIARLESSLAERNGAGIDESIARLDKEIEDLRAQQKRGDLRLAALRLLQKELETAQFRAKERYLAPVTGRIEPYLQLLFPGARVRCNEELVLEAVERSGTVEQLERLSDGTREQIAVLTRLAFADLLLDSGRPAAIILDDSLAFSDPARLDLMFDVLSEAAKKIQITILSCHDRAFERLGANRLVVDLLAGSV